MLRLNLNFDFKAHCFHSKCMANRVDKLQMANVYKSTMYIGAYWYIIAMSVLFGTPTCIKGSECPSRQYVWRITPKSHL